MPFTEDDSGLPDQGTSSSIGYCNSGGDYDTPRKIAWGFWYNKIMQGFEGAPMERRNLDIVSKNLDTIILALEPITDLGIGKIDEKTASSRIAIFPYKEPIRVGDIARLFYDFVENEYALRNDLSVWSDVVNDALDILKYLKEIRDNPEKMKEDSPFKAKSLGFLRALERPPVGDYHPLDYVDDEDE